MSFNAALYLDDVFGECIRDESDLSDNQREAIEWAWQRPFSGLYLDVGMGKTAIVLSIVDRLILQGYKGKILIIAPIRVATRVWPFEPRLWRHTAWMRPIVLRVGAGDSRLSGLRGSVRTTRKRALRNQLVDSPNPIHVINQEAVEWIVGACARTWPYQVVIFDEASRLRDHNSVVFKSLQKVLPKIERFHQLTASPASQTYMHFFSQIYLLDRGQRFGRHITRFRERYFTYNHYNRTWTIRQGAAEEIEEKIADIVLVMRREKNFIIRTRRVRLPRKTMQAYRDFERDSILEIDDQAIDAINGAALSNKLLQFASGAVYDETKRYHVIHDEKIDELRQLADETLDNPVMVAYWYKSSLARLRAAFPQAAVMDREGKVEGDWNKRKFKMMFVHPRGSAHGLNLQFGGHHIVLFDIFWPLELFTQLIGRLDRQGQTNTVMVHLLSTVGTHDEVVSANLEMLRSAEEAMFRRLQDLRKNLNMKRVGG